MKKIMLLISIAVLVTLCACGSAPQKHDATVPIDDSAGMTKEVYARIKFDQNKKGTFTIENKSDVSIQTMPAYVLEKKEKSSWEKVNLNQVFTEPMIKVKAGDKYEQAVDFSKYETGEYRIKKTFYMADRKQEVTVLFNH